MFLKFWKRGQSKSISNFFFNLIYQNDTDIDTACSNALLYVQSAWNDTLLLQYEVIRVSIISHNPDALFSANL